MRLNRWVRNPFKCNVKSNLRRDCVEKRKEKTNYAGAGIGVGAGLGIIFSLLLGEDNAVAIIVGAGVGLIVGAIWDMKVKQRGK